MKKRRNILFIILTLAAAVLVLSQNNPPGGSSGSESCVECHMNAGKLIALLKDSDQAAADDGGSCAVAPTRQPFLNAFVKKSFPQSLHGMMGCVSCHGGDPSQSNPTLSHVDMKDAELVCAGCHADVVELHATSIHFTLAGQNKALEMRSGTANYANLETVRENDCNTCHAGCADCHITIPQAVGGGLISGHQFFETPPMEETCAVCHGSRAGAEYLGTVDESIPADVHFGASMTCLDCHQESMHGDGEFYDSRWEVAGLPCTGCHDAVPNETAMAHNNPNHSKVSCQVCHSVPYNNCADCHSYIDPQGEYHRKSQEKTALMKVGRNTVPGYPYEYVPVR